MPETDIDPDDEEGFRERYEMLLNRCMIHKCRQGYCLNPKRTKDGKMTCRFGFAFQQECFPKYSPARKMFRRNVFHRKPFLTTGLSETVPTEGFPVCLGNMSFLALAGGLEVADVVGFAGSGGPALRPVLLTVVRAFVLLPFTM